MTVIDELIAILGFEVEGGEKVKEYQKTIDDTEQSARKSTATINKMGVAAGAFTTAAIAVGTAAVKNFAGFEREMTRIGITAGATAQETVAAGDEVQRLAKQFALPLEEAISGLDTLTASGMDLQRAMAFLPSVLATAQASGAATADVANTIQKASATLGISAQDAQRAFDLMVAGGKAGQFELRDMAQYLPTLSGQFAALGYSGEDGLRKLIVLMQLMRERTGSSSEAATQLSNILQKVYSNETQNAFKKMGVDLEARMKEAVAGGEDALTAFTRITRETIGGDLTLLPKLFSDAQFQQGMLTLVQGADGLKRFDDALQDVDGSTMEDLNRVLGDTQASLDKTSSSIDRFWKSAGNALAGPTSGVLDAVSNNLDYGEAIRKALEKQGMGYWARENWMFMHSFDTYGKDYLARRGGFTGPLAGPTVSQIEYPKLPNTTMADLDALRAKLDASVERILGAGSTAPVINDNRQDNRQYPVSVSAPVTVQVQQATAAPAAVGGAIAGAIGKAAQTPARQAAEPASTGWGGPR